MSAISSSDPKAVEKLTTKLEVCQREQERMKAVNQYYRKNGTLEDCPHLTKWQAAEIIADLNNKWRTSDAPYPQYMLSNNSAEIRRLKQRIEQITRDREVGFAGWAFPGGKAVTNTDLNRLQLLFDERPDREQCTALKRHGFHWSSREQAWQRQLNHNAIYAASRIDFIQPENGESPLNLQPKQKKRDDMER